MNTTHVGADAHDIPLPHLEMTMPALLGDSPAMRALRAIVEESARSDAAVFITGERGTGHELVARHLHMSSARAGRPFVTFDCRTFPDALLEAELFGYDAPLGRGSAKGAPREGRLSAAQGGTLFFDAITDLSLGAQQRLATLLASGSQEVAGPDKPPALDVRFVCATEEDSDERVAQGLFRRDLFERLSARRIQLPALRARTTDLRLLVLYRLGERAHGLASDAWRALEAYAFPGNVRELERVLGHALARSDGEPITLGHLPDQVARAGAGVDTAPFAALDAELLACERAHLERALARCGGRRARAAALLGVSRKTLWRKLQEHAIQPARKTAARAAPLDVAADQPSDPEPAGAGDGERAPRR